MLFATKFIPKTNLFQIFNVYRDRENTKRTFIKLFQRTERLKTSQSETGNITAMTYTIQQHDEVQLLEVDNLVNEFDNRTILREVIDLIESGANRFIIDLKNLKFLNSAGLNFLISVLTRSRNAGGDTVIANVSEEASQLLVITKLKQVFTTAKSVDEAKDYFAELA